MAAKFPSVPCATVAELRKHLVEDNDWTAEEFDQFTGYYFRNLDGSGGTFLTFDQWEALAQKF